MVNCIIPEQERGRLIQSDAGELPRRKHTTIIQSDYMAVALWTGNRSSGQLDTKQWSSNSVLVKEDLGLERPVDWENCL